MTTAVTASQPQNTASNGETRFLIVDIRQRVGNTSTPHYAVARIQEELDKKQIPHDFCLYDELIVGTHNGTLSISANSFPLSRYTHIVMRGHRTAYEYNLKQYVVAYAKNYGITVQNSAFISSIPHYNKLIQMTVIAQAGLPYIDSFYSIDGRYWEKTEELSRIGFPLIYKHTEGVYRTEIIDGQEKLKKNVFLVHNVEELKKECLERDAPEDTFVSKPSMFYIQKYVESGEDYRAIMIGGKFFSGWKRVAQKGFLTVSKGSMYSLYDTPDPEFVRLAQDTAALFQADYCAVDIIYSDGKPYILEVNMNPGFKAFETKLGDNTANVALAIVEQMLEK